MPNFIVLALKGGPTASKIAKNCTFWYKFALKGKCRGTQKKLNIGAQLQTFLYAMTPQLFWKLHCFIAFPLSQASSFQSVTNKQTDRQKHHTFSSSVGARPTIPTILGMVIEEVRNIFAPPPNFFDPISSFAARGYWKFVGKCPTAGKCLQLSWLSPKSDQIKKLKST